VRPLFCLLLGASFVASSGSNIAVAGASPGLALLGLFGGIVIGVGVCILLTRVAVSASGLAKRAPFAGAFRASWDEVEAWWVHPGPVGHEMLPHACFRLRGRRGVAVVYAADACRPAFDAFLEDVRARVAEREIAEPGAAADGHRDRG
jgi:hypothetical protein